MIRQWYEPASLSEWFKRIFSLLNITVCVFTFVFIVSEFRFDWVEKMLGAYLVSTNQSRPESGAMWETGRHTSNAHAHINQIISKKEDVRQNVNAADSFSLLVSSLQPGEWVTIEKHQFKELYQGLQGSAALKVIEPAELVWLLKGTGTDRIFCEGVGNGIKIYFLDTDNRVIRQIEIQKRDILEMEAGEKPFFGRLDEMDGFAGRIYSSRNFFDALFKLPPDILPDLMADPEILLDQDGRIVRIGIWNEAKNGYIRLGYEFESENGYRVVFVNGREWAVWQLSLNLKGEES